jgi:peptidyl-prolyl cis-trans isomerase SurA
MHGATKTIWCANFLFVVLTAPFHAHGETVPVDSIVAVVEDSAIFRSEVNQALKQIVLQRGIKDPSQAERAAMEEQVLLDLINSKLIVAKAGRLGLEVSFSEIEKHVDQTIEENKRNLGGEAAFVRALETEGLTLSERKQFIREQIRNRMLVERVLASEIDRGSLQISDAELILLYEQRKSTLPMRPAVVHLRTIYISMESSQSAQAQAKARIDSVYRRVLAGDEFEGLAREYSEDPSAKNGGALGSLKISDLSDPEFAGTAGQLSIGEVSEPVLTSYGYHLIKMTGADPANDEVELSHILIKIKPGDDDIQDVFKHANSVHDMLVAGAPFDSTAIRYSDDKATAEAGGDLGWLRVADLPEFFRDVLTGLNKGDISPVLREPAGFRIVQLVDSEDERPYEYEEVADDLRKLAEQEKLASAYEGYLTGLRNEFYVDVRGE